MNLDHLDDSPLKIKASKDEKENQKGNNHHMTHWQHKKDAKNPEERPNGLVSR